MPIDHQRAAFELDLNELDARGLGLNLVAEAVELFYLDTRLHPGRELDLRIEVLHAAVAAETLPHY